MKITKVAHVKHLTMVAVKMEKQLPKAQKKKDVQDVKVLSMDVVQIILHQPQVLMLRVSNTVKSSKE